jgi:hypothetical protein
MALKVINIYIKSVLTLIFVIYHIYILDKNLILKNNHKLSSKKYYFSSGIFYILGTWLGTT